MTPPNQEKPDVPASAATSLWTRWVPRILLLSAALVILGRIAAPFQIGKDQSVQVEGARRLLAGQGLTDTYYARLANPDITDGPKPIPITQWPPGLSLVMVAFLASGTPLLAALKLFYVLTTAAGWSGWAIVSRHLFGQVPAIPASRMTRLLPLAAAALTPIFYTPLWNGTDIVLWAGVPWVLLWTVRPAGEPGSLPAAAAGALVGILFAFRYASFFLGLAGGAIILCAAISRWNELLKRLAAFGVCSLLVAVPVAVFMKSGAVPLYQMYMVAGSKSSQILEATKVSHHAGRLIFGSPVVDVAFSFISWAPLVSVAGVLIVLVIIFAPFIHLRQTRELDFVFALLILPAALVIFLALGSEGYYLGIVRYYEPVLLCWVLACVALASSHLKWIAWGARGVLTVFLAYVCGGVPLMAISSSRRPAVMRMVLGYTPSKTAKMNSTSAPISYPDYRRLFSNKEDTRDKVLALFRQYPDALFLVEEYQMFVYDGLPAGPKPGDQIRQLPDERYLASAFSSIDRKIFAVVETGSANEPLRKWVRKIVYRNEWEKTLICEIDVKAGQRVLDAAFAMPAGGQ